MFLHLTPPILLYCMLNGLVLPALCKWVWGASSFMHLHFSAKLPMLYLTIAQNDEMRTKSNIWPQCLNVSVTTKSMFCNGRLRCQTSVQSRGSLFSECEHEDGRTVIISESKEYILLKTLLGQRSNGKYQLKSLLFCEKQKVPPCPIPAQPSSGEPEVRRHGVLPGHHQRCSLGLQRHPARLLGLH